MAVLVEGLSVVVRCESVDKSYLGGIEGFISSVPNGSLRADGELACVTFMTPVDTQNYIECLKKNGLDYIVENKAIDVVVVDQLSGLCSACDWAEFGETYWNNDDGMRIVVCQAKPTSVNKVVVPDGWSYDKSLSLNYKYIDQENIPENLKFLRSEGNLDVLVDESTGQEYFVNRS